MFVRKLLPKSSSAAERTRRPLGICPHVRFDIQQIHYQLQDPLVVGLATQVVVHTCVSTFNKVIISYRTH